MAIHMGNDSFVCNICEKGFVTHTRLRRHLREVHGTREVTK